MNSLLFKLLLFFYTVTASLFVYYLRWCNFAQSVQHDSSILTYDFVVVGGGSAGSVLARRLAEDPGTSVLLLEAGGPPCTLMDVPVLAPMLQLSEFDWQFRTEPQREACLGLKEQRSRWPRGKVLGGSSRLNFLVYLRGDPRDYDEWESQGNAGWAYRDVLPFFKKSEDQRGSFRGDERYHGTRGPFTVSDVRWASPISPAFLKAGEELGYQVGDLNGDLTSGFMLAQLAMRDGQRVSCDAAYLRERRNLHVLTYAHAHKVLFHRGNEAFGVQFLHDGQLKVAVAKKEVILSSGALGSPHLLLLSGLGPAEHLRKHGIKLQIDLPGVGKNLQDHVTTSANLVTSTSSLTLQKLAELTNIWEYVWSGEGPLTSAGCEALALVHTNSSSADLRPDVQLMLMPIGFSTDCGTVLHRMIGITDKVWEGYFQPLCGQATASVFTVLLRPHSRGDVTLQSADPTVPPAIDPKYLSHPKDLETMVQAMHFMERLVGTAAFSGTRLHDAPMPGCEHLAQGSDQYWACYVRHLTLTCYHPSGTCKMGPRSQPLSVVDSQLRVHGARRLRVVDASIIPSIVGANINAATIMIAEKAAHMIRSHWSSVCSWSDLLISVYLCVP